MASTTDYLKVKYSLKDLDDEYYESIGLEYRDGGRRMSSFQRFIIAVLLLVAVFVIGTVFLVVNGKIWLF
jgi:hypothetical protein